MQAVRHKSIVAAVKVVKSPGICSKIPSLLLKIVPHVATKKLSSKNPQLLKVLTTPVIVGLELFIYKTKLPWTQCCALIPTCIGVVLATVTHLEANLWGSIFGALGIVSTSFYQIWVKTEQKALNVNAQQLLHNQSFVSFFLLLAIAPICEDVWGTEDSLVSLNWVLTTAVSVTTYYFFCGHQRVAGGCRTRDTTITEG